MPSTYSPNLRIELIASGEQANTWGNTTNTNLGTLIEQAIAGLSSIDVTAGNVTLTAYNGASDQSRQMILNVTGTPGVARTLTAPSVSKVYVIANNSNADVTIETATGTGVTVSSGYSKFVFCDGTDFSDVTTETTVLAVEDLIVNGDATLGDALTDVITINGTVQPGVVISGSSSSAALRITQTGAGNALVVEDSANPDSSPFVVDTVGHVVVGTTAANSKIYDPQTTTPRDPYVQIQGTQSVNAGQAIISWSSSTSAYYGPALYLAKSASNTINTQTVVTSGTTLGSVMFSGDDGTNFVGAAKIAAEVDGTPGTNDMPGRIIFSTTADGASSPTERMRIDNAGRVGIGGGASAGDNIRLQTPATGATTTNSIFAFQEIRSDVTAAANIFRSSAYTQTTTFNLPALRHFFVSPSAFGAGSTVTNQFGFFAENTLTGATTNYGFYSNLASGSGRYNFYAAGTADNYFGGPVVVSTSSSSDALRITQTGAGNALLVEDSANPDSTPFVINTDGRVVIGNTVATTFYAGAATPNFQIAGGSGFSATRGAIRFDGASASSGALVFGKSRSTSVGGATIVNNGDYLGEINFQGADGTNLIEAALIRAEVDGTPGTNDMPGRLLFSTTADGASSPTERMRIDSAGRVGIGGSSFPGINVFVPKTATGAVNAFQIDVDATVASDVTSSYTSYFSYIQTQAAAFTLGSLNHFSASQRAIGAGSTVTNQIGFRADSTLTGATNNYGFYSSIASGSGRYNFYAAGTADNYFAGNVLIGLTGISNYSFVTAKDITGGTSSYGVSSIGTIQSDVTTLAQAFRSRPSTAAVAFTLGTLQHFAADQGTIGAGSTLTNQYGFFVNSTLTGATNNYGFYSNIASGTGRYNFYAAGTADNYFAGLILSNSSIKSNSATAGIGYGTGAGGTVTQTISRTTGVTLNKICGSVTLFSASATVAANFTVTNSAVSATDTILCSVQASGATEIYQATSYAVANGSFKIYMASPGTATEAPTINFTVIKSVTA